MSDRSIWNEMEDIKRIISDKREMAYKLQEGLSNTADRKAQEAITRTIRDHLIIVKALELYLDSLEGTLQANLRHSEPEE